MIKVKVKSKDIEELNRIASWGKGVLRDGMFKRFLEELILEATPIEEEECTCIFIDNQTNCESYFNCPRHSPKQKEECNRPGFCSLHGLEHQQKEEKVGLPEEIGSYMLYKPDKALDSLADAIDLNAKTINQLTQYLKERK